MAVLGLPGVIGSKYTQELKRLGHIIVVVAAISGKITELSVKTP
jgi:hypothetical protein